MSSSGSDRNEAVRIVTDYYNSPVEITLTRSGLRKASGSFMMENNSDPFVPLFCHVSQDSLNDFKRFVENDCNHLEINDANFDDLYLLTEELNCRIVEQIKTYSNEYFRVNTHQRLLECLRKRIRANNATADLEERLQKALCKSHFDISDESIQECVQEIGLSVFLRIFAMKDRELVRYHLDRVIDFVSWVVDHDDRFGSCGSYLLQGVDLRQLAIPERQHILGNGKFDKSVLTHEYFEAAFRHKQSIYALSIILLIALLTSFAFVSFCVIEENRHRRRIEEIKAENENLAASNLEFKTKNEKLEEMIRDLERKNGELETTKSALEEIIRDLERKNGELERTRSALEGKNDDHKEMVRDLERKNGELERTKSALEAVKHDLEMKNNELAKTKLELIEKDSELVTTRYVCEKVERLWLQNGSRTNWTLWVCQACLVGIIWLCVLTITDVCRRGAI